VRTYSRAELAALVGRDTRLHVVGLHHQLWCRECGEPPFAGWVVSAAQESEQHRHGFRAG
jgi:hypothetical protein